MKAGRTSIPQAPKARRDWIINRLSDRGLSLAELGRRIGLSRATMSNALYRANARAEAAIAEALDVSPRDLFRDRYCGDARIPTVRARNSSRTRTDAAVRDGEAA